jgi:predicted homoserine dehydrogenase-like protein
MELIKSLNEYAASGRTIKVGLVGAGQMGEGLACQMELMTGMRAFAVADVVPGRPEAVLKSMRVEKKDYVLTDDLATASQAVRDGKHVGTSDAGILSRIPDLDIIVEATGIPEIGAQIAYEAILNRKHVLQMNVETDATVGYILRKMARAAGVVYTLTAGDEPGTTMELYDFAKGLGFEVVAAGKGKNNPLNREGNPENLAEKAKAQQMNPKMLASFVDGTKTMVEMTSLGNAIGFVPDVRGMHGAEAGPKTLQDVFIPKKDGGILNNTQVVEYCRGIAPGVFVIFTTDHPKLARDLKYLSMGPGPYWALYRPYHLTSLETPVSIARAVLNNETTIATDIHPVCETVTYAKKDLKAGDKIDALGGFTVYGMIESSAVAAEEDLLPLGLAPNAVLKRDVKKGEPVSYADVDIDTSTTIYHLRTLQEKTIAREKNA